MLEGCKVNISRIDLSEKEKKKKLGKLTKTMLNAPYSLLF